MISTKEIKMTNAPHPYASISLRPGIVVDGKNRPKPFKGSRFHARQHHSGAPWHPDYVRETEAITETKLPYRDKSEFDTAGFIDEAINKSMENPAVVGTNGNFIVFVDFGHDVGFDALRNRRTSVATVIMKATGEVITVFPGRPKFFPMPVWIPGL